MKMILSALFVVSAFATTAFAEETYPGGCKGKLIGDCTEVDGSGNTVGPNNITCIVRDSDNVKYTFTGSYQKPTSYNVNGALNKCKAASNDPASCHWTACVWAD